MANLDELNGKILLLTFTTFCCCDAYASYVMALTGIEFAKQVYDVNALSFTHSETRNLITFFIGKFGQAIYCLL